MLKREGYPRYRKQTNVPEGMIHVTKWKLRSCPRCGGDMFTDKDLYGLFEQCLQCGYVRYLMKKVQTDQQACNEKEEGEMVATLREKSDSWR